jgi:hypothetical protein
MSSLDRDIWEPLSGLSTDDLYRCQPAKPLPVSLTALGADLRRL